MWHNRVSISDFLDYYWLYDQFRIIVFHKSKCISGTLLFCFDIQNFDECSSLWNYRTINHTIDTSLVIFLDIRKSLIHYHSTFKLKVNFSTQDICYLPCCYILKNNFDKEVLNIVLCKLRLNLYLDILDKQCTSC